MTVEQHILQFWDSDNDYFCDLFNTHSNNDLSCEINSSLYFDFRCIYDNCYSDVNPDLLDNGFRNEIDSEYFDRNALSSFMSTNSKRSKLNFISCNFISVRFGSRIEQFYMSEIVALN